MERIFYPYKVPSFPHRVEVRIANQNWCYPSRSDTPVWLYSIEALQNISQHFDLSALGNSFPDDHFHTPDTHYVVRLHEDCGIHQKSQNSLYRAEVKKVIMEKKLCRVFLVDRGEEILCSFDRFFDIHKQPAYVLNVPMGAFQCYLDSDSKKLALKKAQKDHTLLIIRETRSGIYSGKFEIKCSSWSALQQNNLAMEEIKQQCQRLQLENEIERWKTFKALKDKEKMSREKKRMEKMFMTRVKIERDNCRFVMDEMQKQLENLRAQYDASNYCSPLSLPEMVNEEQEGVARTSYSRITNSSTSNFVPQYTFDNLDASFGVVSSSGRANSAWFPGDFQQRKSPFYRMNCLKCRQQDHNVEKCPFIWTKKKEG